MRKLVVILLLVVLLGAGAYWGLTRMSLSALDEPGAVLTWLATRAKHLSIGRAAHSGVPAPPPMTPASVSVGEMIYHGECQNCHGLDGRTPTALGKSMYPRSPSLASPQSQAWSDAELFWIIKHGIRHSGMPGFARSESDEQIWRLVHYIRSLRR
jgi:mono/diheme cytochrome c family protein